jgi:hypothetical protein
MGGWVPHSVCCVSFYAAPPLLPAKDYGNLMGGQYPFQYDPVYGLPIVREVAKYGEVLRDIRQVRGGAGGGGGRGGEREREQQQQQQQHCEGGGEVWGGAQGHSPGEGGLAGQGREGHSWSSSSSIIVREVAKYGEVLRDVRQVRPGGGGWLCWSRGEGGQARQGIACRGEGAPLVGELGAAAGGERERVEGSSSSGSTSMGWMGQR